MISLLIGKKGSGKTKKLIEKVNTALASSGGNVVVIEKGMKLTYDIPHKARLVDSDEYDITGAPALFGFISGICAGNYDVTDIFVDSTLKIVTPATDDFDLERFIGDLEKLGKVSGANIVLSVSLSSEESPESCAKYIQE